jgi:hypothetical protein
MHRMLGIPLIMLVRLPLGRVQTSDTLVSTVMRFTHNDRVLPRETGSPTLVEFTLKVLQDTITFVLQEAREEGKNPADQTNVAMFRLDLLYHTC